MNLKKMANIKNFSPGEAANKFYDKHLIKALDKFTAQEKHLRQLVKVKEATEKMKRGTFVSGSPS